MATEYKYVVRLQRTTPRVTQGRIYKYNPDNKSIRDDRGEDFKPEMRMSIDGKTYWRFCKGALDSSPIEDIILDPTKKYLRRKSETIGNCFTPGQVYEIYYTDSGEEYVKTNQDIRHHPAIGTDEMSNSTWERVNPSMQKNKKYIKRVGKVNSTARITKDKVYELIGEPHESVYIIADDGDRFYPDLKDHEQKNALWERMDTPGEVIEKQYVKRKCDKNPNFTKDKVYGLRLHSSETELVTNDLGIEEGISLFKFEKSDNFWERVDAPQDTPIITRTDFYKPSIYLKRIAFTSSKVTPGNIYLLHEDSSDSYVRDDNGEKFFVCPEQYEGRWEVFDPNKVATCTEVVNNLTQPLEKKENIMNTIKEAVLVNGQDSDNVTVDSLLAMIRKEEADIESLQKIKAPSKGITKMIAAHNKNIAALVKILDKKA